MQQVLPLRKDRYLARYGRTMSSFGATLQFKLTPFT